MRNSRRRRNKREEMDIDITSLLDILVILLVFLLKSYNPTDFKLDLVDNLKLPDSISKIDGNEHITIQVNKDKNVWINNKALGKISNTTKIKEFITDINKKTKEQYPNKKLDTVNIVLDQALTYKTMDELMNLTADVGLTKFKFVVEGEYN